jgi:hypothetical protein
MFDNPLTSSSRVFYYSPSDPYIFPFPRIRKNPIGFLSRKYMIGLDNQQRGK